MSSKTMDALIQKTLGKSKKQKGLPKELKKHMIKENEKMCLLEAYKLSSEKCPCCNKPNEATFIYVAFLKKTSVFKENNCDTSFNSHISLCKERNIGFHHDNLSCNCKKVSLSNTGITCLKEQGGITKKSKVRCTIIGDREGNKKTALRVFENKAIIPITLQDTVIEIKDNLISIFAIDKILDEKARIVEIFKSVKEEKLEGFLSINEKYRLIVEAAKLRTTFQANEKIESYSNVK